MRIASASVFVAALVAGCGQSAAPADMAAPPDLAMRPVGQDTSIVVIQSAAHPGGTLTVDGQPVVLPDPALLFSQITLHIDLGCPQSGCDPWDRLARVSVVEGPMGGGDGGVEREIEIGRYITPYGVRGKWDIDVTDLAPLLSGTRRFRSYVETWAGGWTVTATLVYKGGVPALEPVGVVPLAWRNLGVGDAKKQPVDAALPPTIVTLPAGATKARVRLFVTGHGQGNGLNCAEFCDLTHSLLVDGAAAGARSIWRDDCDQNPLKTQRGNWQSAREGWCPGLDVAPWTVDLGARSAPFTVSYGTPTYDDGSGTPVAYDNTCSPDSCNPLDCPFGGGAAACQWNDSSHTSPNFSVSAIVIGYR